MIGPRLGGHRRPFRSRPAILATAGSMALRAASRGYEEADAEVGAESCYFAYFTDGRLHYVYCTS